MPRKVQRIAHTRAFLVHHRLYAVTVSLEPTSAPISSTPFNPTKFYNNEENKPHFVQNPQDIHRIIHTFGHFSTEKLWKSAKICFSRYYACFRIGLFIFCGKSQKSAFYAFFKKISMWKTFFIPLWICGKPCVYPSAPTKRGIILFLTALYLHILLLKTLWKSLFFIHSPVFIKDVKLIFVCYYGR